MRGFTDFAGRLTRLVYCRERGTFVAETVPHAFEASGLGEASPAPSPIGRAGAVCSDTTLYPVKGGQNDR